MNVLSLMSNSTIEVVHIIIIIIIIIIIQFTSLTSGCLVLPLFLLLLSFVYMSSHTCNNANSVDG